jgi:hypothetical protein
MIDWPNLLVGAVIGFLLGLIPWRIDRRRVKRERVSDARAEWMNAAKQIELAVGPKTTSGDFYQLRVSYAVDHWRRILGPHDFVLLDRLESSIQQFDGMTRRFNGERTPENWAQVEAAMTARNDAFVGFANMSRAMQSESYNDVINAEERGQFWRDFKRHPVHSLAKKRRNQKARARLAPPS